MVERVEIDRGIKGSFLIEERTLRRIYGHIGDAMMAPVQLAVSFRNDRTIREENIETILSDSSISNWPISRITFSSIRDGQSVAVMLDDEASRPAHIQITGGRRFALSLEDSIANELNGARNPWWLVNSNNWPTLGTSTLLTILSFLVPIAILVPFWASKEVFAWAAGISPWWLLLFFVSPMLSAIGPVVAPKVVFNFGRGRYNHGRSRAILGTLFGVVLLGVVVNKLSDKI